MAHAADITEANRLAFERLTKSDPVLADVRRVGDFVAGFTPNTILTSGPPMAWQDYTGGQREAIIGGALFEGLAKDREDAIAKLDAGEIVVGGCHDFGCVGSLAGIYTASMPAFVVENRAFGNVACCNIYEGSNPRRLNYGVYDDGVRERLLLVQNEIVPVIAEALRQTDGIPLKPIIKRALGMGDELHSRNTAAALLFLRELVPNLLTLASSGSERIVRAVKAMTDDHYFFLRLSMAAAKATADAARNIERSSVVTALAFNCRGFALRVSGLGDTWFKGPHASVEARLFEGHTEDEITWMGGESIIAETIGLGGFAQASAPSLQSYQGGSYETMLARNKELYAITVGENPDYLIPALGFRGTPTGIDIFKVIDQKVLPVLDIGIAGRNGGQIGAGVVRPPLACFETAAEAYRQRYSS
ncbi:MAG TPA: DUF1116 domain-containing protein [Methyloceanibacter sp.]|jgi:Protein of unknown function (DUF1116)|nr:DUF1116 domain-containing protein [Methyloceanibacter sp.]